MQKNNRSSQRGEKNAPLILVIGKDGQIGWELRRTLMPLGTVVAMGREKMDFTHPHSIIATIRQISPDIIINAAAYTAVDQAEEEKDLAMQINGVAPGILAEEAQKIGALLIHYSTDYVFDGTKETAYTESDVPCPINVYGATKLAGEKAIQSREAEYLILRTSWVYCTRGHNFLLTMLRLMRERESLRIIKDQIGVPTWARLIAETTAQILKQSLDERREAIFQSEIYHLTSADSTSWHGFATRIESIIREKRVGEPLKIQEIEPVPAERYSTRAKRPLNSCMAIDKLEQHYNMKMPAWHIALRLCMEELP